MRVSRTLLGVMIMVLFSTSCNDTTIDPFDNEDRLFTIYGFLDPLNTLQTIRIIPITRRNEEVNGARALQSTFDAEVFSIDLTASTIVEWIHSLKQFPDNTWGHFFTGNFRVRAGHRYRMVITRKDGSVTTAETIVPFNAEGIDLKRSEPYFHPVLGFAQDVTIPGGRNVWDFQTVYILQNGAATGRILVPFENLEPFTGSGPWTVTLPLEQDQNTVAQEIAGSLLVGEETNARLIGMGLLFRVVDDNWITYQDQTDTELLSRGDNLSNVVNGAGFFGSMGLLLHEWNVPLEFSQALGYSN